MPSKAYKEVGELADTKLVRPGYTGENGYRNDAEKDVYMEAHHGTDWFHQQSKEDQAEYLKNHPGSKYRLGSVAERIASRHSIASRIVNAYMVLKVPVGYSFIHNAKSIISAHSGVAVEDEDLEAIIARFLDLVIFSLTKDPDHAGDSMPSTEQFFQIVDEVLQSSDRYGDDEDDMDRYDDEDLDDEDEGRF
jgi:hypothetical protein